MAAEAKKIANKYDLAVEVFDGNRYKSWDGRFLGVAQGSAAAAQIHCFKLQGQKR